MNFFTALLANSALCRQSLMWALCLALVLTALFAHRVLFRFLKRYADQMPGVVDSAIVQTVSTPALFLLLWGVVAVFGHVQLAGNPLSGAFGKLNSLLLIVSSAWFAIKLVKAGVRTMQKNIDLKTPDNLRARKNMTQLVVFQAIADTLIVILALILSLLTFDTARAIGLSLLTSAGIIGVVVGFAAQKSLGLVLAGLQIALTQPVRIDDVVVVEGEWGRVEEITLTYVVVRIWDERRLILPVTYFLEHPFQNWTRTDANICGTVCLYLNYDAPVDVMREALANMVAVNTNWDGRVADIQITETTERYQLARILVSSADSSKNWNLRVAVREQMIAFLNTHAPGAFVRAKITLDNTVSQQTTA